MQSLMAYPFDFNILMLVSGLPLMASGGCKRRSLTIERVMLIGFLLCVGVVIPSCLCDSKLGGGCIEDERRALLAIKADIYDPDEWLSSWTGQDCCQWRGVGCTNTTSHVVKLNLRYPYLYYYDYYMDEGFGKVPARSKLNPSISSLIHLRYLDLSMNNFSRAPIPEFIGSLMHLEYLNLSFAGFSGSIPRQIGNLSSLHSLDLQGGFFVFLIKDVFYHYQSNLRVNDLQWLSRILSLRYLDLSSVNLSKASNWLHEINMHPSLSVLKLSYTELPGFPSTLQHVNFTSLTMLDLSNNAFESTIPHWLLNISSLVQLSVHRCNFQGKLSAVVDILGNLNRLKHLDFSLNQITGEISESLWSNKHMEYLDLSANQITGHNAKILGNLSQLRLLDLSYNLISGEIPRFLGNFSHLEQLYLGGNIISGEITISMGNLLNLKGLYLDFNQIRGWKPEANENLVHLQFLSLSNNNITGQMPEAIVNLLNLEFLFLSSNQIREWIPEAIGNLVHLQYLDLSSNSIAGQMPETIGNLIALQFLQLSDNHISGKIPENISKLCNLQQLDLSYNSIGGEITSLIEGFAKSINNKLDGRSCLQSLELIYLNNNNLSGTIPKNLGQLFGLRELHLSSNSFIGYLTEVHFFNLTRLQYLDLSYNSLKMIINESWIPPFKASSIFMCSCQVGPKFPAWLRTPIDLNLLCLSEAGISGSIPSWFWSMNIYYLNMSHNCMEGQLPGSVGSHIYNLLDLSSNCFAGAVPNVTSQYLILSNNSFSGPISLSYSGEVDLIILSLSHNHINGSIPPSFCNWTSLEVLDLSNNELSGGFPECWSKSQPEILHVSKNRKAEDASGTVVYPMKLKSLHMRNNNLSGQFPSFLRHCKQLVLLDLGENKFSGNMPIWIGETLSSLRVLRLRSNSFDGNIPMQVSGLTSLQVLDLACNNFSGNLPSFFGNFTAMVEEQEGRKPLISDETITDRYKESLLIITKGSQLEYTSVLSLVTSIDLSHNNFYGEIPDELTNLRGLHFLNLSRNHLIGNIPQNIGDMKQLESLDLSMNDLSGQIPQTMVALNFLSYLNLSYNNLSGRIPSEYQFQTFNDTSYVGNHNLCGQPLPDCPKNAPSQPREEPVDEDGYEMIWIYASSALGFVMGFWGFIGVVMIKKNIRISYLQFIDKIYDWIYVQVAIKFAKLKSVKVAENHRH